MDPLYGKNCMGHPSLNELRRLVLLDDLKLSIMAVAIIKKTTKLNYKKETLSCYLLQLTPEENIPIVTVLRKFKTSHRTSSKRGSCELKLKVKVDESKYDVNIGKYSNLPSGKLFCISDWAMKYILTMRFCKSSQSKEALVKHMGKLMSPLNRLNLVGHVSFEGSINDDAVKVIKDNILSDVLKINVQGCDRLLMLSDITNQNVVNIVAHSTVDKWRL